MFLYFYSILSLFLLGIHASLDHFSDLAFRRGSGKAFGLYWNSFKMAKYGDLEARPDDGQNEFSDIIKSRSGE
jgi:hypothetical protein